MAAGYEPQRQISSVVHSLQQLNADSVYMLLHPGWTREARSNRWHFATRWAKHLPVVLVVPETMWPGRVSRKEPRIKNCRILKVVPNFGPIWGGAAQLHTAQILNDMKKEKFKRPILWLYNAGFSEAFAALPSAARVHHVTENYFDFPDMSQLYLDRTELVTKMADLNVAVSEGCARPLLSFTSQDRVIVATNGCDFSTYGRETPKNPRLAKERANFRRVAVFAGNINDRLNFELLSNCVRANRDTLWLFIGRVTVPPSSGRKLSALKKEQNVQFWDPLEPELLPGVYRGSDFGIIPYTAARYIVDNGFPLKALEMAATGLPVISTYMAPLASLSPPLAIARSDDDFLQACALATRHPKQEAALKRLAAQNDYDARFAVILEKMSSVQRTHLSRLSEVLARYPGGVRKKIDGTSVASLLKGAFLYGLRYRFYTPITRFIDSLPAPLRNTLVYSKRAVFGRSKADR